MLAFDRGYTDYSWFADLSRQGVYFVTRMKDNADYIVVEERELPHRKGLLRDQVIGFYQQARDGEECYFRRIEFYDEQQDRVLVFLTNHLTLAAATVAEVYKQRWQIELFFKALKQNLRLKTFVGTSANALKTQVWAALIAMLLIKYLQLKASFGWSLSNLVALLRQQLFKSTGTCGCGSIIPFKPRSCQTPRPSNWRWSGSSWTATQSKAALPWPNS